MKPLEVALVPLDVPVPSFGKSSAHVRVPTILILVMSQKYGRASNCKHPVFHVSDIQTPVSYHVQCTPKRASSEPHGATRKQHAIEKPPAK